jgi:hypothetical protein
MPCARIHEWVSKLNRDGIPVEVFIEVGLSVGFPPIPGVQLLVSLTATDHRYIHLRNLAYTVARFSIKSDSNDSTQNIISVATNPQTHILDTPEHPEDDT